MTSMLRRGVRRFKVDVSPLQSSWRSNSPYTMFTSYPECRVSTASNGVRVATETLPGRTATIQVWINAGSRYETAENNGAAHFLEHLKFKGTRQRTRVGLEKEVENIGAHLNAYTSREHTVFFASVFQDHIPQSMDILSDILQYSRLDPRAIDVERDVILRELQEIESIPEEVVFDRLHESAYPGQSLGHTILGSAEQIARNINRDMLLAYIDRHYTTDRFLVVGTGAVDHDQLVELTDKHFGDLNPPPADPLPLAPAQFTPGDTRVRNDELGRAHWALAFKTEGVNSADAIPLLYLQTLLGKFDRGLASQTAAAGNYSHSNLVESVIKSDCVDKLSPFVSLYNDTGLFGLYVEARPCDLNEAVYQIMNGICKTCYDLTDEKVLMARHMLKAATLTALDGTTTLADEVGRQMLCHGRRIHPAEIVARIDNIDTEAVRACAKKYLEDADLVVSALGAINELPDYDVIRRRTYWNR
ncbi:Mitochondrial-processing peptidase subunit beta [Plasmodiophora brassicae]